MTGLAPLRNRISQLHLAPEETVLSELLRQASLSDALRQMISADAATMVEGIRADANPGLMEVFLAEYGLSTDEGIALMCLAEALLRVPDNETIDELIEDKIAPSSWSRHLGKSSSPLVNASTWALMLTGKVLNDDTSQGMAQILHGMVRRLGEPVIRVAVKSAMKELGNQFVLGETIVDAMKRAEPLEAKGFTFSYDMLGEAAMTAKDAARYFAAYSHAIKEIGASATSADLRENPGISIKLSALHPRYEVPQRHRALTELVESTLALVLMAKQASVGLNIDAEEADRLELSLDVIERVLADPRLAGWDGFGVVVQAYGKRAAPVLDWLYELAGNLERKIMVRLVKGAYWDSEIKRAQVEGLADFPVFTRKPATDASYIACAKKLLGMTDRIYPQFATHNAHTVAAIINLANDKSLFEFQRLHGMGEALHRKLREEHGTRCRIYAPVGAHRNLLAYLVRRMLENGANSSFVNQIMDREIAASDVTADPVAAALAALHEPALHIRKPIDLYQPERPNSKGWDLRDAKDLATIEAARQPFASARWQATPLMAVPFHGCPPKSVLNPADIRDEVGTVVEATADDVKAALAAAINWGNCSSNDRTMILNRAADLYEQNFGEFFAVLTREAGKTPADAIAELREAVDFLRYYAARIEGLGAARPRGITACISPWNFPLAIFTGQMAAALAAGNGVIAKPADPTPIVAYLAVQHLHAAGVPHNVLQLLPGRGSIVGAALVADPRISSVCFTGSTSTAQIINASMAKSAPPDAPLVAETGGLNAMIVDSTALPEQAVRDIVNSSFRSAGQRCSALRILYLQEDIADDFLDMLFGAMDELVVGNPWDYATDVGPVISASARQEMLEHISMANSERRLFKKLNVPDAGHFVGPTVVKVRGMIDMKKEIFGPVLHVATFKAADVGLIVEEINASRYGLTFGLHTRIDARVENITTRLNVGNIYVNRNQIGAIVGSQPFGGEALSGTGPKAGGPHYVRRFTQGERVVMAATATPALAETKVQAALHALPRPTRTVLEATDLPGPTGESNRLSVYPRGVLLCLGPTIEAARQQAEAARECGCPSLIVCPGAGGDHALNGFLPREALARLQGFEAVALWSDDHDLRQARLSLAQRRGQLVPLITVRGMRDYLSLERHVCIDTTASGGNANLLAGL